MKKINVFLSIVLVTGAAFITSCNDTTEGDTQPVINFVGGAGYISEDATLKAGELFQVGITALSNTTSNAKLSNIRIVRTFNNVPFTVLDSTINTDSYQLTFETVAYPEAGVERWTFTVTDKDGESSEIFFNITTTGGGAITTYTQKMLGSYDNSAYGSSFASADGTVYFIADAKANAAKVDWLYFYGVSNGATIAAPDDAAAATIFNSATNGLQTWSVRNNTRFGLTSGITWGDVSDDALIVGAATGVSNSKANQLAVGNIVAFKTSAGKMGLIKVTDIVASGDGTITYDVKVQQ